MSFCVTKGYVCGDRCYVIAMARAAPQQSDGFADAAWPLAPPLSVKIDDSRMSVPALESVPVLGAFQKAPRR